MMNKVHFLLKTIKLILIYQIDGFVGFVKISQKYQNIYKGKTIYSFIKIHALYTGADIYIYIPMSYIGFWLGI